VLTVKSNQMYCTFTNYSCSDNDLYDVMTVTVWMTDSCVNHWYWT